MSSLSVVTLGCRLNHAESARLAVSLADRRDTVVVNTCAVTAQAVRQSRRAIRQARRRERCQLGWRRAGIAFHDPDYSARNRARQHRPNE